MTRLICDRYVSGSGGNASSLGNGGSPTSYTAFTKIDDGPWHKIAGTKANYFGTQQFFAGIKSDGTLWAWGYNGAGQLGQGDTTALSTPTQIGIATNWVDVACGAASTYAVNEAGELWVCGDGTNYVFGTGATTSYLSLTKVGTETTWAAVAAGTSFAVGLRDVAGVVKMYSCGLNSDGRTGLGTTVGTTNSWTEISGAHTGWVDVATSALAATAVKSDGTLWAFGDGSEYLTGQGTTADQTVAVQIGAATTWLRVTAAASQMAAINSAGDGYVWGSASATTPQLASTGVGSIVPVSQGTLASATATKIISAKGTNTYNTLGLPTTGTYATFTDISSPTTFTWLSEHSGVGVYATQALILLELAEAIVDAAAASDTFADATFTMYLEAIGLSDSLAAGANTTSALTDSASLTDSIRQAINQIVADTAAGADTLNLGAALTLVDIANAVATQTSTYNSVMLVAELIATLEAFNGADSADIVEAGVLTDAYVARVEALVALLESHYIIDVNEALVHVMQSATDSADGATAITSTGSMLNALLNDGVLATIRLNIGGELFTGWVLNTDTLAPSEYQFADLQFNSACKYGDRYLMAADDGIYQFTEDTDVETVMTYIKTGKTDFGSDMRKRVEASYMVYSATGNMALKVTTSENGQLQTNTYTMTPFASSETQDAQRNIIGKGLKSRYWQFELVGADAGCEFDEIGMLPVVLSRRI
jgi:hypothetical protein